MPLPSNVVKGSRSPAPLNIRWITGRKTRHRYCDLPPYEAIHQPIPDPVSLDGYLCIGWRAVRCRHDPATLRLFWAGVRGYEHLVFVT